jgi:hypothetical protein
MLVIQACHTRPCHARTIRTMCSRRTDSTLLPHYKLAYQNPNAPFFKSKLTEAKHNVYPNILLLSFVPQSLDLCNPNSFFGLLKSDSGQRLHQNIC